MRAFESKRTRDCIAGALMFALGIYAAYQGGSYRIGSLGSMGPGFFPVTLGVALALIGIAIIVAAPSEQATEPVAVEPQWRGWLCILGGIVAFLITAKHLGLLPASFTVVFISAFADRQNTVKDAFVLALAVVVVCYFVFWWGLRVELPLFRWS